MSDNEFPHGEQPFYEIPDEAWFADAPLCEPPPETPPFDFAEVEFAKPEWRKLANGVRKCSFIWQNGMIIFKKRR